MPGTDNPATIVILASKFGWGTMDDNGDVAGGPNGRPDYVRASVERSLRHLGTDRIDLYYQHRVDPGVPVEETFGALGELVAAGKVRYLGICTANLTVLERVKKIAAEHQTGTARLALAWVLGQGPGIVPIPGTRRLSHLLANLEAAQTPPDDTTMRALRAAVPAEAVAGDRVSPADHGIER